jgi:glutaredoxin-like protein NrdH
MTTTIDSLDYTNESGDAHGHKITVYALSTCGFCRRGLQFLRDNKIAFKYVYVDKLDYDVKEKLKSELQSKFDVRLVFPYMVLDDKKVLSGFIEDQWKVAFK